MSLHSLKEIRKNTHTVKRYLAEVMPGEPRFTETYENYQLNSEAIHELGHYSDDTVIVAFSAEWCKDCHRNIPILHHISESTGIEVRVFGHLMRDAKNINRRWKIPPSPAAVEEFNVGKIPLIVILDAKGKQLGRIIENPPKDETLEDSILSILLS